MPVDISIMLIISLLVFWYVYRVVRHNENYIKIPVPTPSMSNIISVSVDPPSGWKYGFPRDIDLKTYQSKDSSLRKWLVSNGYPKEEVEFAMNHLRMWYNFH